jgi:hypothetical protein
MRWLIPLAVIVLMGCGADNVLFGPQGGSGGASSGGAGGASAGGNGMGGGFGGVGGSGSGGVMMQPFINVCKDTNIVMKTSAGDVTVDTYCPGEYGAMWYDGAVSYEVFPGANFLDTATLEGCNKSGAKLQLQITKDTLLDIISSGIYDDGSTSWAVSDGTLSFSVEGDEGEMVEGAFDVTFSSSDGSLTATGTFATCHVPDLALP